MTDIMDMDITTNPVEGGEEQEGDAVVESGTSEHGLLQLQQSMRDLGQLGEDSGKVDADHLKVLQLITSELLLMKKGVVFRETLEKEISELERAPPSNWHQAVILSALIASGAASVDEDDKELKALGRKAHLFFAAAVAMVFLQVSAAFGVLFGILVPSCGSNYQCGQGRFCNVGTRFRCGFCGVEVPLKMITDGNGTWNRPLDENFQGYDRSLVHEICREGSAQVGLNGFGVEMEFPAEAVQAWCSACVNGMTNVIEDMTQGKFTTATVEAMVLFDWLTLMFSALFVGMTIVGELKDIELCLLGKSDVQPSHSLLPTFQYLALAHLMWCPVIKKWHTDVPGTAQLTETWYMAIRVLTSVSRHPAHLVNAQDSSIVLTSNLV